MTKKRALPGPATAPYRNGDLLPYAPTGWQLSAGAAWLDNVPFHATLELGGIERGRSAAHFLWNDADSGANYQMFMTDVADLMQSAQGVQGGKVRGWWIVVKRGNNYGVARINPEQVPDDIMTAFAEGVTP